jgi:hypothetical protein
MRLKFPKRTFCAVSVIGLLAVEAAHKNKEFNYYYYYYYYYYSEFWTFSAKQCLI